MRLKKRVIPMLAGAFAVVLLTSTASAHPGDYWYGKYIGKENAWFTLKITESAQTDLLDYNIYRHAHD